MTYSYRKDVNSGTYYVKHGSGGETAITFSSHTGPVGSIDGSEVESITYPEGGSVQYTYDGRGNKVQVTFTPKPNSGLATLTSTAHFPDTCTNFKTCNQPDYVIDTAGNRTDYAYDPNHGGVLTKTSPAGANGVRPQIRYAYQQLSARYLNSSGQLVPDTPIWKLVSTSTCQTQASCGGTADEVVTTIGYDNNLLPSTVTTAAGDGSLSATVTNTYDPAGNLASVTDPLGVTTRYSYDANRRKVSEIGPAPNGDNHYRAARTTYDQDDRVIRVEQGWTNSPYDTGLSSFTSLSERAAVYDGVGHKIEDRLIVSGATQGVTDYAYDAMDRVVCTAVRMNPSAFNSLPGACTASTLGVFGPDRITYTSYDAASQVLRVTSGYGTSLQRDDQVNTYGPDGELQTQADAKGNLTTSYYDGFTRLGAVCYPDPAHVGISNAGDCERYGFDNNANMVWDQRRDGQVIHYGYDALNRKISGANGATYAYDNLGRMTQAALPGLTTTFGYDALGRQTRETGPLGTVSRQFDLNGNRTRLTWPDGFALTYNYDAVGELAGTFDAAVSPTNHVWDDLGRLQRIDRNNGVGSFYSYGADLRLSAITHAFPGGGTASQTYSFTYNPAGQVVSASSANSGYDWSAGYNVARGYTVDGLNRYTSSGGLGIGYDGRGNLTSDGVTSFAYDVTNKLTALSNGAALTYDALDRLWQTTGASTTRFLYDGQQIIGEYDASGNVLRRYEPGPGLDDPLVWYEGAGANDRRFLLADRQGSVIGITNGSGVLTAINRYDEAGIPGPNNTGRFQYTGAPFIPEAGLYHMRARAYSPTLGRFMQTDSIGYKDGLNWYAYVHNDPVNKTDPTGNDEVDVFRPFLGGYAYHEAEFVGNDKTGWTYISKDGAVGGGALGPSKYTIISVPSLKSGLESAAKQGYTSGYHHDASPTQDAANVKAATAEAKKDYNVATCNCGQAVGAGERAAGTPGYSGSSPNPKDAAKFEASPQGRQAGWTPVVIPTPPPPPKPLQQQ